MSSALERRLPSGELSLLQAFQTVRILPSAQCGIWYLGLQGPGELTCPLARMQSACIDSGKFACRKFAELAFARAGIPIRWEGPVGVTETGVISEGDREGQVVVRISPKYFRPAEVSTCISSPTDTSLRPVAGYPKAHAAICRSVAPLLIRCNPGPSHTPQVSIWVLSSFGLSPWPAGGL